MIIEKSHDSWVDVLLGIAKHYRLAVSEENVRVSASHRKGDVDTSIREVSDQLGLKVRFEHVSDAAVDPWRQPLAVEFKDGRVGLIEKTDGKGNASVLVSGDHGLSTAFSLEQLKNLCSRVALVRPATSVPDARVDEYIKPYRRNWFWEIVLKDKMRYGDIVLASLMANVLALAGVIFSMQVYDRVIPAQSEPTLWVLFFGVLLAVFFEFFLRIARARVSDLLGKRADLKMSDFIFGRALRIRNDARPKSTGSFIAQVRELEQVRELITSTTLNTVADLPFVILFLFILYMTGGPLVYVALAALPFLIIPGLLAQKTLARLSNEGMRESAIRNAMLVEAVEGVEDIKRLRAEHRFQNQWNQLHSVSADIAMRQRRITNGLLTWTQELQGILYASVLMVGCYLVMKGEMTTGALVGSSILASRMMAPLAQLSGVFVRWQQAKVARKGLDEIVKKPTDQPEHGVLLYRPCLAGNYSLENVQFQYDEEARKPALGIQNLKINAGERVAILGRIGSGKSTLLQLLAGMRSPQQGIVSLDGLNITMIDPYDVRRDVGLLAQDSRLFFGTVRDNLTLGRPLATDDEIIQALEISGAIAFVRSQPAGLDYMILEGGQGLSGGQRQTLLLARTIICQPNALLLDEPTAWLDDVTEHNVIEALDGWIGNKTLVVATHRLPVLRLVQRIIVLADGKVVMDGSKDAVLGKLQS
ncbi:type I secretion system permease/ATPase [Zestomonas carbonaria]|uniref:Vitamin B12 import ATP-binding protein BtuD n=1 Tax=Zestomonas carbonaria TaxID=2762745 RepID=A0A7U7EQM6_9GAMM|nr:type I secretion system permease/ATPase [Pseudomonas carbonaria]CAD5109275.1 Vitamin B12 import ATP-binding protein BtuD [Pseudomonas carbonaria]